MRTDRRGFLGALAALAVVSPLPARLKASMLTGTGPAPLTEEMLIGVPMVYCTYKWIRKELDRRDKEQRGVPMVYCTWWDGPSVLRFGAVPNPPLTTEEKVV